ncbi:MAG: DUF1344 domain-containing protein [Rhizobiales bacterium]|nr:DUF1344 domain-containing protein [Hyphomicrobiales bacterium]
MKNAIIPAIALSLAVTVPAFAGSISGTVNKVDKNGDSFTLSNGTVYVLPEGIEAETLHVGDKVKVTYSTGQNGKIRVSAVSPAR